MKKLNIDITKLQPYAKAVGAFLVSLAGFATVVVAALADNSINASEWVSIIGALGVLAGAPATVYVTPNKTSNKG